MAHYIVLKSSGSEFLEMLRTPFYVWYVKGNRCLLFILYSGMGNLSDESCKTCKSRSRPRVCRLPDCRVGHFSPRSRVRKGCVK